MGIASSAVKLTMSQPIKNSKTQKRKAKDLKENPVHYIACKACHATGITLIKAEDSYYCKFCFDKLKKKKFEKKGNK